MEINIKLAQKILMSNIGFMNYYKDLILFEIEKNNGYIIELGCGSQNYIEFEDEIKDKLIGIDISFDKLCKNPYANKIACDVHYMPIKTGTVNTVISR